MAAIKESTWQESVIYTWSNLSEHHWEDFRIALMEAESVQNVQGVKVQQSYSIAESLTEEEINGVKIVYSPAIMESKSDMIVDIVVSERDYKSEMIKYLPLYERKSGVFKEIIAANDREFRNLEQKIEVAYRNLLIDTAIESLPVHERDLGIKTLNQLNYVQRREQIMSRYRAAFDQTTENTIKTVAEAYSNGKVEINKTSTPGVFEIKFVGTKGIPNNINGLKEAIDIIIPAHLDVTYAFTFNAWNFLANRTWNDVGEMTWNDLRTWNEVS